MKYLIKSVYEVEIEIEADSIEDAREFQNYREHEYTVTATIDKTGEGLHVQYVDQMIFPLGDTL
jgi:hypothetical protein